ncbi:hypothetical protein AC792_07075 [Arthrobacter sp. RIT-PI-e]|nr:hypothetical protein AC792_07075 [Arthrobacter sp. RIT-PI-e]
MPRGLRTGSLLAALALTLTACSPGGTTTEPTEQEPTVQSASPEPTPSEPTPDPGGTPSAPPSTPPPSSTPSSSADAGPSPAGTEALLPVTLQQDAAAGPVQYVLECVGGAPGAATTLPGAESACAALTRLGAAFFTARPDKDVICTQQYGGPQTASITGTLDGTSVIAAFSLTDGCQISRWTAAQDILGAPGAS